MLGREPREITRHYYNKKGQVVRSVTVKEAEWTDEDLALHTAHVQEQAGRCPGVCGLPLDETTAMADGEPVHTFTVSLPHRCHACDAVMRAQDEAEQRNVVRPGALLRHVEKVCDC